MKNGGGLILGFSFHGEQITIEHKGEIMTLRFFHDLQGRRRVRFEGPDSFLIGRAKGDPRVRADGRSKET